MYTYLGNSYVAGHKHRERITMRRDNVPSHPQSNLWLDSFHGGNWYTRHHAAVEFLLRQKHGAELSHRPKEWEWCVCVCVCVYVSVRVCMYVCAPTFLCMRAVRIGLVYIYAYIYMCMYVHILSMLTWVIHACMRTCLIVHVCIYTYARVSMYALASKYETGWKMDKMSKWCDSTKTFGRIWYKGLRTWRLYHSLV